MFVESLCVVDAYGRDLGVVVDGGERAVAGGCCADLFEPGAVWVWGVGVVVDHVGSEAVAAAGAECLGALGGDGFLGGGAL